MNRWRKMSIVAISFLVAMALPMPPVWAQEDTEVEIEGTVEQVDLGAGLVVVDGTTCHLTAETAYLRGQGWRTPVAARELAVGQLVEVAGLQQADGTILVHHIRIKDNAEQSAGGPGAGQHPVAVKISRCFDISYEQVMALYEAGVGFGDIMQAYRLAAANPDVGVTGADLLELKLAGAGWGEICKQLGIHPGGGRPPWAGQGGNPHKNH